MAILTEEDCEYYREFWIYFLVVMAFFLGGLAICFVDLAPLAPCVIAVATFWLIRCSRPGTCTLPFPHFDDTQFLYQYQICTIPVLLFLPMYMIHKVDRNDISPEYPELDKVVSLEHHVVENFIKKAAQYCVMIPCGMDVETFAVFFIVFSAVIISMYWKQCLECVVIRSTKMEMDTTTTEGPSTRTGPENSDKPSLVVPQALLITNMVYLMILLTIGVLYAFSSVRQDFVTSMGITVQGASNDVKVVPNTSHSITAEKWSSYMDCYNAPKYGIGVTFRGQHCHPKWKTTITLKDGKFADTNATSKVEYGFDEDPKWAKNQEVCFYPWSLTKAGLRIPRLPPKNSFCIGKDKELDHHVVEMINAIIAAESEYKPMQLKRIVTLYSATMVVCMMYIAAFYLAKQTGNAKPLSEVTKRHWAVAVVGVVLSLILVGLFVGPSNPTSKSYLGVVYYLGFVVPFTMVPLLLWRKKSPLYCTVAIVAFVMILVLAFMYRPEPIQLQPGWVTNWLSDYVPVGKWFFTIVLEQVAKVVDKPEYATPSRYIDLEKDHGAFIGLGGASS